MSPFPFRGFQNHNNPYYKNSNKTSNFSIFSENNNSTNNLNIDKSSNENTSYSNTHFERHENRTKTNNIPFSFNIESIMGDGSSPIIEIMGIKLYIDDILILVLLFLLYKEEVKDEMLYISLILLLLS